MVTKLEDLSMDKIYSYADYLTWEFKERVELIKGRIFKMSPAPNMRHQLVSSNLLQQIWKKENWEGCKVFHAPFDVRLLDAKKSKNADKEILTVVQPDICAVCDRTKLDEQGCVGAPDWIIEILSPGNSKKELNNKFDLYQENGVKEYWLVAPSDMTLTVFVLRKGKYQLAKMYSNEEIAKVEIFPDLKIDLELVFED